MTDLATVGEVGVWGEPVVWVRPNGIDNFGVAHFGKTCPPGWVMAAKPYYTRPLSSFPKTENVEPSVSTSQEVEQCSNCASLMEQNTELDKKLSEWVTDMKIDSTNELEVPRAKWVGLTDEELLEAAKIAEKGNYLVAFQRIQQKLKEKNA